MVVVAANDYNNNDDDDSDDSGVGWLAPHSLKITQMPSYIGIAEQIPITCKHASTVSEYLVIFTTVWNL